MKVYDRKLNTVLIDKRDTFSTYFNEMPIWIAMYHLKYFMFQSILKFYDRARKALIRMITRVNVLLIRIKKQCSEFTCIIPLLKKVFWENL